MTENDMTKVASEVEAALKENRQLSDAGARVVASLYHMGQTSPGHEFLTTGAIPDPVEVWRDLFDEYSQGNFDTQLTGAMMLNYLIQAGKRGPVPGWSDLWL
jgi:hypothetical protein